MYSYTNTTTTTTTTNNNNNNNNNTEFCNRFLQIKLRIEKSTVY